MHRFHQNGAHVDILDVCPAGRYGLSKLNNFVTVTAENFAFSLSNMLSL